MAEAADAPKTEEKVEAPKAEEEAKSEEKAPPKGRGKGGKGRKGGKGGGKGFQARTSGMKQQLIDQVKNNQRIDPGWRAAWGNYCQQHGSDVRDPSKHAQSWLTRALSILGSPRGGGGYQGGYMQARASPHVVEQVKMNQRADPGWSQAWMNYCMMNGSGISDPAQHADRWLIRACQCLGPPQVAYQYMDSMGMVQQVHVPMQGNYIPQMSYGYGGGYQQRQGSYPRSRGGYGGGGAPRSRGGGGFGGKPRSRGGFVPNLGMRGGLSRGSGGQRGGLRSRGGGGGGGIGGGGAPRSRGGGGATGRPRSRGGFRPQ